MTAALGVAAFASPWITPVRRVDHGRAQRFPTSRVARRLRGDHGLRELSPDPARGVDYPRVRATAREVSARTIDFLRWLDGVRAECVKRGAREATVRACFDGMEPYPEKPRPRSRPPSDDATPPAPVPETRKVEKYLERIVTRDRVEMGAVLIRAPRGDLLAEVHDSTASPRRSSSRYGA